MANQFKPLVDAKKSLVELGKSISLASMFDYMDLEGDPMRRFRVTDMGDGPQGGFFTYRGRRLDANTTHEFAVSQLKYVRYSAGLTVSQELFRVQAFDGDFWSDPDSATVFTQAANQKPVVEFADGFSPVSTELYRADAITSTSDGDGEVVDRLRIRYQGASAASLSFKGQSIKAGTWFELATADLGFLKITTNKFGGASRVFKLQGRGYDGRDWGNTTTVSYRVAANNKRPEIKVSNPELAVNQEMFAANLFTFTDGDLNTPKWVRFYETGVRAEGGYFSVDGVQQQARKWFTVAYDKLDTVKFHAAEIFDKERVRIQVSDGFKWSKIQTSLVETVDVPVVSVEMNVVLEDIADVSLSSLFTQLDDGPRIRKYRIYDANGDNRSARLIDGNGNRMAQEKVIELTADEFREIVIRGGKSETRWHDEILIRANNGKEWSGWERLNVYTEPNHLDAFDLVSSWSANNGQPRELTYTFLQEVPFYYAPDADERDGFFAYDRHPNFSDFTTFPQHIGARRGLNYWANVSGLSFRETTQEDDIGHITFGLTSMDGGTAAYAYLPASINPAPQGDIWLNEAYAPNYVQDIGSEGFLIHLHEMGHAFGLRHPFDDGDTDPRPFLPKTTDSEQFTVMSYTQHHGGLPTRASTPMLYDIAAIQHLYGQNTNFNSDKTIYRWDRDANVLETIWDGGGRDTILTANQTRSQLIDLRQGRFSNIGQNQQNVTIAFGSVIENAVGGVNNDVINGNEVKNFINGREGDDTLRGYGGSDTLVGGEGNDVYIYSVGDGNDTIREDGGRGRDRLEIHVPDTIYNTFANNPLENSIKFRQVGDDLQISLLFDGDDGRGTIRIKDQAKLQSRVETLRLYSGDDRAEVDVDMASLYQLSSDRFQHFTVTDFKTNFGYIAQPV